ncbi:MAG: gas vesicle protein K [Frankia sp.]|nr:gas vesicle protein K [Frankia sp.]
MTARRPRGRPVRLTADPAEVGRGLGQVVVVLLELLRDLLERQALRRVDSGELPAAQVEELGRALIEVRDAIAEVRRALGISAEQARAATARARELVGEWPPAEQPDSRGDRAATATGDGPRAGRRPYRREWPASAVRGVAPPGWDMP